MLNDVTTKYINVLIAEDNKATAKLVKSYLELNSNFKVRGIADNGDMIVTMAATIEHDVIIMDINMPHLDGITAMEVILNESPEDKILIFSSYEEPWIVKRVLAHGACGFFSKKTEFNYLLDAVEIIKQGGTYIDKISVDSIIRNYRHDKIGYSSN